MQAGIRAVAGSRHRRRLLLVAVFTSLALINVWLWIDFVRTGRDTAAPETIIAIAVGSVGVVALYLVWRTPVAMFFARTGTPSMRFALATHQAGHIVASFLDDPSRLGRMHLHGPCVTQTSIVPLLAQQSMQDRLAHILSGMTAEEIFTGESSSHAADDLARATELGADMVGRFGMAGSLVSMATGRSRRPRFIERVLEDARTRKELEALLRDSKRDSMRLMLENRHVIIAIRDELLRKEKLGPTDVQLLFDQARSRREDADQVLVDLRTAGPWPLASAARD